MDQRIGSLSFKFKNNRWTIVSLCYALDTALHNSMAVHDINNGLDPKKTEFDQKGHLCYNSLNNTSHTSPVDNLFTFCPSSLVSQFSMAPSPKAPRGPKEGVGGVGHLKTIHGNCRRDCSGQSRFSTNYKAVQLSTVRGVL